MAPLARRILALRHNFTVDDVAYVALAEVLAGPLLTCDAKFIRAPGRPHRAEIHLHPA
ncbi:twitching motility protein PilT [Jiangella aurantiaca]|uniref:Twitching motility protein PilT n=1 Tax=Jiangella aurantiaca TaxID=2530373 RepID=A0A4R5ABC6_9ACTN|nr:twitching motility protein PilT [Jiangella aurantiaca]